MFDNATVKPLEIGPGNVFGDTTSRNLRRLRYCWADKMSKEATKKLQSAQLNGNGVQLLVHDASMATHHQLMPRILIFDEHSVYRTGLCSLICVQIPRAEVLEASSLIQALSRPIVSS